MKTLCFGGSFNPVHTAHLRCSTIAATLAHCGRLLLIPARQPALKSDCYELASAEHRVAMLRLAAEEMTSPPVRIDIDTLEIDRAGPTFTIDTVLTLRARDETEINWLIGADQLLNLHRWHRFEELLTLAQFWVMARPGYQIDWDNVQPGARGLQNHVVPVPQLDISATDIRRRIREGRPLIGLVPERVREYILSHGLYIP